MKVESPKITYGIDFEQDEKTIFTQCADILFELLEEMDKVECFYIGCGDEEDTDYFYKEDIGAMTRMLWHLPQGFKICQKRGD